MKTFEETFGVPESTFHSIAGSFNIGLFDDYFFPNGTEGLSLSKAVEKRFGKDAVYLLRSLMGLHNEY